MLSKILVPYCRSWGLGSGKQLLGTPVARVQPELVKVSVRHAGHLLPPTQYDIPFPKRLRLGYTLRVYWEVIPLFVTTCAAMTILFCSIVWACKNKVDVVFSPNSCNNISRTMNLRRPTSHKIVIINQRYEPWPEMQDVLDKMLVAEHRAMMKATKCSYEQREGHPPL